MRYAAWMGSLVFGIAFFAVSAQGGDLVAESDTGAVFSGNHCKIEAYEVAPEEVQFFAGTFDYLRADVPVTMTCVTRRGRTVELSDREVVAFPTLRFDWANQGWRIGGTTVAWRRAGGRVELNEELTVGTWSHGAKTHVSFRVEFWEGE